MRIFYVRGFIYILFDAHEMYSATAIIEVKRVTYVHIPDNKDQIRMNK